MTTQSLLDPLFILEIPQNSEESERHKTMTEKKKEASANSPSHASASISDVLPSTGSVEKRASGSKLLEEGEPVHASLSATNKHPDTPDKSRDVWWLTRFKEHPFKALSLAVSVYGGLILLTFFVHLGSMPELDLAGATATLAAVAVIGLLVVFTLGGATIAAGVATRMLALDAPHLTSGWSLASLALPGGAFITVLAIAVSTEALKFEISWLWGLLGCSIAVPVLGRLCQLRWQKKKAAQVATSSQEREPRTEVVEDNNSVLEKKESPVFGDCFLYAASGFVWCASVLMAFVAYEALASHGGASNEVAGFGLALWGGISIFLNILVVEVPPRIQGRAFLALGGASVLILTMLTASWSAIPVAVVRTLGLGEIPVGVVVTAEGCDTFNKAARGQKVCHMDADQKQGWVCPAILKSRIGAPLVFELTSIGDNGIWPILPSEIEAKRLGSSVGHQRYQRIQVAKSDVKSWPSITPLLRLKDPQPASDAAMQDDGVKRADGKDDAGKNSGTSPRRLVTYLDPSVVAGNPHQKQWMEAQCGAVPKAEGVTTAKPGATENRRKPNSGKQA